MDATQQQRMEDFINTNKLTNLIPKVVETDANHEQISAIKAVSVTILNVTGAETGRLPVLID